MPNRLFARGICQVRRIGQLLAATILLAAMTLQAHAELPPLPAQWQTELAKVQPDPPPKQLAADAHFVISDERAHFTLYTATKGLGGVLLGVGTDPNYLFAGWMRADLVLLVDFDQVVADVHGLYALAFRQAAYPAAFAQLWTPKGQPAFAALIDALPDAVAKKRAKAAYKMSRGLIYDKILHVKKVYKEKQIETFLSDPEQYNHVRDLVLKNRVWAWRGDLTGSKTMVGLQTALKAIGQQVMVFYITNAEAYFDYTPQARINLRDLPYAEKSVVLRTQGRPDHPEETADGHYRYMVQNGRDFAAWMQLKRVTSAKTICWSRKPTATQGLMMIGPPPLPKPPAKQSKAKK